MRADWLIKVRSLVVLTTCAFVSACTLPKQTGIDPEIVAVCPAEVIDGIEVQPLGLECRGSEIEGIRGLAMNVGKDCGSLAVHLAIYDDLGIQVAQAVAANNARLATGRKWSFLAILYDTDIALLYGAKSLTIEVGNVFAVR